MLTEAPVAQELSAERLHLQHGPIDVVLKAWGSEPAIAAACAAAKARFATLLDELVAELPALRTPIDDAPQVVGPVARRMVAACLPFAGVFVTPMAAVAGAVADELLAVMRAAAPLTKAFVNDGGDIAIHLAQTETIAIGMAADFSNGPVPALDGTVTLSARDHIGGIATSGRHGRSFSLGIADSVTVLARDAAMADVAATLIANAVDIDNPAVTRRPARALDLDSDLGCRLVTTEVGALAVRDIEAALAAGVARAEAYRLRGLIAGAALTLRGRACVVGHAGTPLPRPEEPQETRP